MTAGALIETNGAAGMIQLLVHQENMDKLRQMFKERHGLEANSLTEGEQALNCINCIVHRMNDPDARPAFATEDEQAEAEFLFPGPMDGLEEIFIQCPALALATGLKAGNFHCQTRKRLEFAK